MKSSPALNLPSRITMLTLSRLLCCQAWCGCWVQVLAVTGRGQGEAPEVARQWDAAVRRNELLLLQRHVLTQLSSGPSTLQTLFALPV